MQMATGKLPEVAEPSRVDELDRLKLHFLASLNHEIRTPLSGVLGMAELMLETDLSREQRDYTLAIKHCARELFELLSATLEYTSLASGVVKLDETDFHLGEMLAAAAAEAAPQAAAKGLEFERHFDPSIFRFVTGDAYRIRQVITVLLNNAIKFTPAGRVELHAALPPGQGKPACLTVSVVDTGIGIALERLQEVFDSFRQLEGGLDRRFTGIGLGLALSRRLLELMGGTLEAESELGKGSTFRFRLPLQMPQQRGAAAVTAAPAPAAYKPSVLVVEDNNISKQVIAFSLAKASFEVSTVSDGWAALEAASQRRFDVILMDLQMPGMDGLETTARLRRLPGHEHTPVLALTANTDDDTRAACRAAGMAAFLAKPIQSADLLRNVRQFIPAA